MTDIVIAAYRRSPFHFAHKGELVKLRPDEMTAQVVKALLADTGADPATIEDIVVGCAFPEGEQGLNVAKLIAFIAGLPESVAGATVNRFCGSSMQSVHQAAGAIRMGAGEAFLCAGVESMSRVPMMGFNPMPHPGLATRRLPRRRRRAGCSAKSSPSASMARWWPRMAAFAPRPRPRGSPG